MLRRSSLKLRVNPIEACEWALVATAGFEEVGVGRSIRMAPALAIEQWMESNRFVGAVEYLSAAPEGAVSDEAFRMAGLKLVDRESELAHDLVMMQNSEQGRDSALSSGVRKLVKSDPAKAISWGEGIKSRSLRLNMLEQAVVALEGIDPEAASLYLQRTEALDDKAELLKRLEQRGIGSSISD